MGQPVADCFAHVIQAMRVFSLGRLFGAHTLVRAISDLRKNLRTVVLLREFQGLTNEETAQHLGLTVAAVKARVFHARRWLRRRLERKLKPTGIGFLIEV